MNTRVLMNHRAHSNRIFRYALFPLLGLSIPIALGSYHRKVSVGESYHQFYTFPKGGARPVVLQYGAGGILHRWISPHALGGTLGLTNEGGPVKVRMELVGIPEGMQVRWENGHTRDFNLETKTVDRILNPGDAVSVHHTFYIGESLRRKPVIYGGGLRILDAATGKSLLFIPIRILNAGGPKPDPAGGDCHEF